MSREHGVGLAVKNNLLSSIIPPYEGNERLLKLQLQLCSAWFVRLINAYAPTLTFLSELKDNFYDDLSIAISKVSPQERLFIFDDFNASVGADYSSWPTFLGHFGKGI